MENKVKNIRESIIDDLKEASSYSDKEIHKRCLEDAFYLYFLLKNNIDLPPIQDIINRMNNHIKEVVREGPKSVFIDREVTATIFSYYILKENGRLETNISKEEIAEFANNYEEGGKYFNNKLYGLIILFSLNELGVLKDDLKESLEKIKEHPRRNELWNDGKNVVLLGLILSSTDENEKLQKVTRKTYNLINDNGLSIYDKVFLAWVLWRNRYRIDINIKKVREKVEGVLESAFIESEFNTRDAKIEDFYGKNIRERQSKFFLAVLYDLAEDFAEQTVNVTKDELRGASVFLRMTSLIFGSLLIIGIGYLDFLIFSNQFAFPFIPYTGKSSGLIATLISALSVPLVIGPFIYDIGVRQINSDKIIFENIKKRVNNKFLSGLVVILIFQLISVFAL